MDSCQAFLGLFSVISWLWYAISVLVAFAVGALWYTVLFGKQWLKAVNYECVCGAKLSMGEKCTCAPRFPWEMVFQFISTAIVGLMYFVLTPISIWMAIFVSVAFSAWTKSMYKFEIASWKRFKTLAAINVGYFMVVSAIFIAMSHL
jgi:hypothetical protein